MEKLITSLESSLRQDVLKYTHLVLNKYIDILTENFQVNRNDLIQNIDIGELVKLWDTIHLTPTPNINIQTPEENKKKTKKLEVKSVIQPNKIASVDNNIEGCQFVLLKGNRKGEMCGIKNKNGEKFCPKHIKNIKEISPEQQESKVEVNRKIYLHFNKVLNRWIEKSTNLVFKSKDEKKVIGKLVDGNILGLDESSIDLCNQYNFRYEII